MIQRTRQKKEVFHMGDLGHHPMLNTSCSKTMSFCMKTNMVVLYRFSGMESTQACLGR